MDDDQQFCLRWNNHQSTLVAVFDTLLENGTLVDCTLAAEGKYLNAHKVVLSACSPYFEALLSQNYDKHPIFILKDVKFQELKAMMDYMYRGEVNISQDQLGALLKAAESLQIKGLSDNRKGETETKKTVSAPPPAKSPPPAPSLPKVQGLTIEQRRKENVDENSRDGSQSPGPRRRKRARRRSGEEIENNHDASNSSESHHSTPAQNIPILSSKLTDVPEPVETKSEILARHKLNESAEVAPQVPIIKEKLETHTELMLEPKAEYVEEMNEDSIEDLTLDDDDLSNMEQMDDQGAGPSHGNMGEASAQGFGWHMGNQSQDEVFLAAQEAVGAHRDSQDFTTVKSEYIEINADPFDFVHPSISSSPESNFEEIEAENSPLNRSTPKHIYIINGVEIYDPVVKLTKLNDIEITRLTTRKNIRKRKVFIKKTRLTRKKIRRNNVVIKKVQKGVCKGIGKGNVVGEKRSDRVAEVVKCKNCDSTFKSLDQYKAHRLVSCTIPTQYDCSWCDFQTNQSGDFKTHVVNAHKDKLLTLF